MHLDTYGKSKPPNIEKLRADVLKTLSRKINGELPFIRATDLRQRVCNKVKAASFFAFLKEMQKDELIMVSGVDETWAQCAIWDHPKMIEWRIELKKWEEELAEIEKYHAEKQRQWAIENAPRLAAERFQKELAEFFLDDSEQLFSIFRRALQTYKPKKNLWLHSRLWVQN